ncbi:MAG: efflux RND transporter periplasmic adaptor subunit [Acidobacteria bacterium]|nr:efflux RND transporter periplasmic adaptor subunit [Acidobacteriota bacterium]
MKHIFTFLLIMMLSISVMAHGGEDHEKEQANNTTSTINISNDQQGIFNYQYTPYILDSILVLAVLVLISLRYKSALQTTNQKQALAQTVPYGVVSMLLLGISISLVHYVISPAANFIAVPVPKVSANKDPNLITVSKESQLLFGVRSQAVAKEQLISGLKVQAFVRSQTQNKAEIVSLISGRGKATSKFTIGSYVKQGETLAVVEQILSATEVAGLEVTKLDLQSKKAELEAQATQALTRRNAAQIELDRARKLYEAEAVPLKRVQEAELQVKLAEEELTATKLRTNITEIGEKRVNPVKTYPLQAPISGVIVQSNFVSGSQIEAGKSLFTILNLDRVWIEAQVFEKDMATISSAKKAFFKVAALPDKVFQMSEGTSNKLLTIGAIVDLEKRTLPIIYEVDNSEGKLRDGMSAELIIDTSQESNVVSIPKSALVDEQGQKWVYIYSGGENFLKRIVTVGREGETNLEITSGLEIGERVVVEGLYQIRSSSSK